MQASTCMYFVRLQVNTCNVQRERLALLAPDLSRCEWSNQHASTDKLLWAPLSLLRPRFRKLRRVCHNLGLPSISANLFCCNNLDYVLAVFGHERRGGGW